MNVTCSVLLLGTHSVTTPVGGRVYIHAELVVESITHVGIAHSVFLAVHFCVSTAHVFRST